MNNTYDCNLPLVVITYYKATKCSLRLLALSAVLSFVRSFACSLLFCRRSFVASAAVPAHSLLLHEV